MYSFQLDSEAGSPLLLSNTSVLDDQQSLSRPRSDRPIMNDRLDYDSARLGPVYIINSVENVRHPVPHRSLSSAGTRPAVLHPIPGALHLRSSHKQNPRYERGRWGSSEAVSTTRQPRSNPVVSLTRSRDGSSHLSRKESGRQERL